MKSRTFYSAIALLSAILVTLGGIGFWWLTSQNPRSLLTRGGQPEPVAAQFVPQRAPLMLSLLARPDEIWQLRQLLTPANRRFAARKEWQSLKLTLEEWVGWNYDADVRPWLGREITLAVTTADQDRDASNGDQAGYLAVLGCRDAEKAREALHLLWQNRAIAGQKLIFDTVSGVPLIYDQATLPMETSGLVGGKSSNLGLATLATAMVGDRYVLLANHPQVLREAIATFQAPDVSLAKTAAYREALRTLPPQRIGWLYTNGTPLMTWLGLEATPEEPLPPVSPGRRAAAMFISFRAIPGGLVGDVALSPTAGQTFPATSTPQTTIAPVLNLLPPDLLLATTGTQLGRLLQSLQENVGGYDLTRRSLAAFLTALSLPTNSLPPEMLTAAQGNYGLGVLSAPESAWVLLSEVNTARSFEAMDALAQQQGLTVSHIQLGNQDVTVWTRLSLARSLPSRTIDLNTEVMGLHTYLNGYEVLSNSLAGLQAVLQQTAPSDTLQQVLAAPPLSLLSADNGTTLYVNWPALVPRLTQHLPWLKLLIEGGQPLTHHLGPILIKSQDSRPSLQTGVIVLKLQENP